MSNVLLALLLVLGCADPPAAPSPAEATPQARVESPASPRVILPDGFRVTVELAPNQELRAQGLMYRDHLASGSGMLFLFPEDGDYDFWMKNTKIPLDMIWIDSGKKIVHVKNDVPPCEVDDCPSYAPGVSARYVLELAAGEAKSHGLTAGQTVLFEGIEGIAVD